MNVKAKKEGQGGKYYVHTGLCLRPCHAGYTSIVECVSLYCSYLFKSFYLSVASITTSSPRLSTRKIHYTKERQPPEEKRKNRNILIIDVYFNNIIEVITTGKNILLDLLTLFYSFVLFGFELYSGCGGPPRDLSVLSKNFWKTKNQHNSSWAKVVKDGSQAKAEPGT